MTAPGPAPDRDERVQRMLDDPDTYFAECRQRAREMVERDVQRDLARRRREFRRRVIRALTFGISS